MQRAGVAQLVERVIGNDEVHGSDSHHQLQKESHPLRVGFLFGISVEGSRSRDQKTVRWTVFRGMGSASKRERSPKGKFPEDCAETPITPAGR